MGKTHPICTRKRGLVDLYVVHRICCIFQRRENVHFHVVSFGRDTTFDTLHVVCGNIDLISAVRVVLDQ